MLVRRIAIIVDRDIVFIANHAGLSQWRATRAMGQVMCHMLSLNRLSTADMR